MIYLEDSIESSALFTFGDRYFHPSFSVLVQLSITKGLKPTAVVIGGQSISG